MSSLVLCWTDLGFHRLLSRITPRERVIEKSQLSSQNRFDMMYSLVFILLHRKSFFGVEPPYRGDGKRRNLEG
jgi:hypothetical protein